MLRVAASNIGQKPQIERQNALRSRLKNRNLNQSDSSILNPLCVILADGCFKAKPLLCCKFVVRGNRYLPSLSQNCDSY